MTPTSRELCDAGVLSPLRVHPDIGGVRRLAWRVLDYLGSQEAEGVLIGDRLSGSAYIHPEKLPAFDEMTHVHPEKLPGVVLHKLEQMAPRREGEWLRVDRGFADFYMTLLATELAANAGLGLLTDLPASHRLATAVRLDGRIAPNLLMPDPILSDLTIQQISISPETSVEEIL